MSKSFKGKKFEVKISATPNKKIPFVVMYIKIDTAEKDLLYSLSKQYKGERLASVGVNPINGAITMIAGVNGLIVECPENKLVNNITQYMNYLAKAVLKPCYYCGEKKGSFKKLAEDMKSFELHLVGKCSSFVKNHVDKKSTKIPGLLTKLDSIQFKDREDIEHKCSADCCCKCCCEKCLCVKEDAEKIDLIMLLDSCDFKAKIEKDNLCLCGCCCICSKLCQPMKHSIEKMKCYRKLFTSVDDINKFVFIFADVRGLNLKFNKTFEFNAKSFTKTVKDACKECCKAEEK